jgi:hypothetical protein
MHRMSMVSSNTTSELYMQASLHNDRFLMNGWMNMGILTPILCTALFLQSYLDHPSFSSYFILSLFD